MADRWTAPGGWVVDVIRLSLTGTGRDGTWLRIRRRGYWIADVRTVAEVAAFLPLASLEPDALASRQYRRTYPRAGAGVAGSASRLRLSIGPSPAGQDRLPCLTPGQ